MYIWWRVSVPWLLQVKLLRFVWLNCGHQKNHSYKIKAVPTKQQFDFTVINNLIINLHITSFSLIQGEKGVMTGDVYLSASPFNKKWIRIIGSIQLEYFFFTKHCDINLSQAYVLLHPSIKRLLFHLFWTRIWLREIRENKSRLSMGCQEDIFCRTLPYSRPTSRNTATILDINKRVNTLSSFFALKL